MAISRERLEELIKQGATVYWLCGDFVSTTRLNNLHYISECNILCKNNVNGKECVVYLKDLYETRKEAEWHLKYHATRTEELDLPMWEEIQSNLDEVKKGKDKINISFIKRFNLSKLGYILLMLVKIEEGPIQLEVSNNVEYMQRWAATEENYIKACDLCIKLFKGEEE